MKRRRRSFLLVVMLGIGGAAAAVALASEPSNHLAMVHVPAGTPGWLDTGVDVQAATAYPVSATGNVFTSTTRFSPPESTPGSGRNAESGPAGQIYTCYAGCEMLGVGYGALVGKIGEDGTPFYVGAGPGFSIPGASAAGGRLYLAVNDYFVDPLGIADNNGGYTVTIGSPVPSVVVPLYGP
jgi:hypothetical protein